MSRLQQLLRMPPEWLEIASGLGAILWGLSWIKTALLGARQLHGPAYQDLMALPRFEQVFLVVVIVLAGVLQIATAVVNEARLRYCASLAAAASFGLVTVYVWRRTGYGPTVACYLTLIVMDAMAVVLLRLSGHVRV